ncbi:hypothetical protein B484DRAFT_454574 [Ochromonadaceae sp. CCMP2298]|nr:hypothetical protein B484DRAFT_454574 [Ochromonadaceae sp. CCMP2298]
MLLRQRLVCAAAPLAFSPLRSARFLPCAQVWRSFSSGEGESNGDGAGGRVRADLAPYFAPRHPANNVPESILGKVGRRLHLQKHHPLNIIKTRIEEYCQAHAQQHSFAFQIFDDLSPVVSTTACFDDLRVGPEHVSRLPSDTYYLDPHTVLRTHTSAHQTALMRQGVGAFLCCGDVYRRDEIDASHYPVFHQMEGVRVYTAEEVQALVLSDSGTNGTSNSTSNSISNSNGDNTLTSSTPHAVRRAIEAELKGLLTGLALHLFGDVQMRWRDDYFPFTEPSFELEIFFNGDWLEVLGGTLWPCEPLTL